MGNVDEERQILHKVYFGKMIEQVPLIRKEGLVPATMPYVLLQGLLGNPLFYPIVCTDTASGVVLPVSGSRDSGKFKICAESQRLKDLSCNLEFSSDRLLKVDYRQIGGVEFERGEHLLEKELSEKEVLRHEPWLALCFGNRAMLEAVVKQRFEYSKQFNYKNIMGMYLSVENVEDAREGAWYVFGLDGNGRSNAGGRSGLDVDDGRLVGVVPEALDLAHRFIRSASKKEIRDFVRENSYSVRAKK